MRPRVQSVVCAFCLASLFGGRRVDGQQSTGSQRHVIVSTKYPQDSLGETVYDEPDPSQSNIPVASGTLVDPVRLTKLKPALPMSARLHHRKINIVVEGVVTAAGDVIDVHILQDDGVPALAENCVKAFGRAKFKPASLNGKPVAVLLQQPFGFNIF